MMPWSPLKSYQLKAITAAEMGMGGMKTEYVVNLEWDSDAAVWVATSEDVPGLALESGSLDALAERLHSAVPELLALN
jgi:hypothetical protein